MPHELSRPEPEESVTAPQAPADVDAARVLLATEGVAAAVGHLRRHDARTLDEQALLTGIPAPPFGEEARGRRMAELMRASGLDGVTTDTAGNVVGWCGPEGPRPLVLAAHLDTVFPADTDVSVTRAGSRLSAPGISDDGRGLAGILAVARALRAAGLRPRRPLLVVATVGEEGVGDLRGVRHLFGPDGAAREAAAFISLDGAGTRRVIHRAVGSWRLRATVVGPGGHSWVDWGVANPLHALARAVAAAQDLPLPGDTTLSVGRMGGGTSVNAIPERAWAELEVRSRRPEELVRIPPQVTGLLERAVADANDRRTKGSEPLDLVLEALGDRPAGATSVTTPLVRAAVAATRALGYRPLLSSSSTDANVPMALGVPAVTLGAGGRAGQAHTLDEWYDNEEGPEGLARALLTILLLDDLAPDAGAASG